MGDLREIAANALGILGNLQEWFPPRSRGRRALRDAIRQIELEYVLGRPHKKKLILEEITAGNSSFADLLAVMPLSRPELEELLQELCDESIIQKTDKRPISATGAGRPVRNYEIRRNNSF